MSKYREIVYMVLDELRLTSDDAHFNEDHIIFLLDKYRAFLLKQRYSDVKKQIPESNYQTVCLELIEVPAISGEPCEGGSYLRSKYKIPFLMQMGSTKVYPIDYYHGGISFVSRNRMRYVGHNRFTQNIIYCSIGPDNYLYFKSSNPQFLYLEQVRMTGIFQSPSSAHELQCADAEGNKVCDPIDMEFPLEEALIPPLIELVVKGLAASTFSPSDEENNAKDDLTGLAVNGQ